MFESLSGVLFLIITIIILVRLLKDSFPNAYVTYLTWTIGLVVVGLIIAIFQQQTQLAFAAVWSIISFPLKPLGLSIVLLIGTLTSIGKDKKISDGGIKQLRIALVILILCSIPLLANALQQAVALEFNQDKIVIVPEILFDNNSKDLEIINQEKYGFIQETQRLIYAENVNNIMPNKYVTYPKYISNNDLPINENQVSENQLSENQINLIVSCIPDYNFCHYFNTFPTHQINLEKSSYNFKLDAPEFMLAQTRAKSPKISLGSFMPTAQALSVTTQVIEKIGINIYKAIIGLFSR